VLQNRTEGPAFFAVIESKGEERSYPYRLATVMGFNNVGINEGGSDASQTIMHSAPHSSFDSKAEWCDMWQTRREEG
jgi:hypothetical protein